MLSRDDVLAIMDHELGNVTTVIVALADALDRRWDRLTETERRDLARRIASQASGLAELLASLRTLRDDGGFSDPRRGPAVDPAPSSTLTSLAEDLRPVAPAHQLVVDIASELPPMRLDSNRMAQVLRNLVGNAAKFAPAGTTIRVGARCVGDWLEVTVDDAGPGIPPEHRERVFDRFFQLDASRPGVGLGLFISRSIVEAAGGQIVAGESPDGGCRMCLRLPVHAER